ncbi:MAG: hypothetical protein VYA71_07230, partial [Pseudomonadota bacterium]|nr:hypothetical protein [Pseudomonadota bacterium]
MSTTSVDTANPLNHCDNQEIDEIGGYTPHGNTVEELRIGDRVERVAEPIIATGDNVSGRGVRHLASL